MWLPHGRHADRLFERVAVPREHGKKGVDVSTGYTESRNSIRPQCWREEMPPSSNNLVESGPEFYISKGNGDGNNDASVGNLKSDFISLAFLQLQSDTVHYSILINLISFLLPEPPDWVAPSSTTDSADRCPHQRTTSADLTANLQCDAYPIELDLGEHGGRRRTF